MLPIPRTMVDFDQIHSIICTSKYILIVYYTDNQLKTIIP